MKLTPASVPNDGVFQLSESFDGVGVMARDPADLAALTEILQTGDNNAQQSVPEKDIATAKNTPLAGLSIGVVSNTWGLFEEGHWIYPDVVSQHTLPVEIVGRSLLDTRSRHTRMPRSFLRRAALGWSTRSRLRRAKSLSTRARLSERFHVRKALTSLCVRHIYNTRPRVCESGATLHQQLRGRTRDKVAR